MGTFWLTIVSLASGALSFIGKIFQYFRDKELKEDGKKELAGEIASKQNEILAKQQEILVNPQTTEKTIEKLNDGKF